LLSAGNSSVPGCGCVFVEGACCVGTVEVLMSCKELFPEAGPLEMNKTDIMQSTANEEANIHVPFSNTSLVCFTPMNWLLKPASVPLKPPPFGFCIKMIKPSITQTIMIRINKTSDIFLTF